MRPGTIICVDGNSDSPLIGAFKLVFSAALPCFLCLGVCFGLVHGPVQTADTVNEAGCMRTLTSPERVMLVADLVFTRSAAVCSLLAWA